jgi:hypothetical protein
LLEEIQPLEDGGRQRRAPGPDPAARGWGRAAAGTQIQPLEEMEQGDGGGRGAARLGLRARAPLEDVQRWRRRGEATRREGRGRVRRWVGF